MRLRIRTAILTAAATLLAAPCTIASASDSTALSEAKAVELAVHGQFRGRYELDTEDGNGRFQVRYARVNGTATLYEIFKGYLNVDFCDRGKMRILDAWASADVTPEVTARLGQFRMPFGYECALGPATYVFSNRAFVGRYMANYRAVGAEVSWKPSKLPFDLAAGIFNPYTISSHDVWTKTYAGSVRARVYVGPFTFNTGFLTTAPDGLRLNIANVGAKYQQGAFSAVAEYYYRHYAHGLHPATHGYVVYGDYKHAMKSRLFNRWSVQARVDGMTHCWASRRDDNGQIEIELDNPQRNRITLGAMVSHIGFKGVDVHFQLNYEKFFWGHHHPGSIDNNDKIVAELQVCF